MEIPLHPRWRLVVALILASTFFVVAGTAGLRPIQRNAEPEARAQGSASASSDDESEEGPGLAAVDPSPLLPLDGQPVGIPPIFGPALLETPGMELTIFPPQADDEIVLSALSPGRLRRRTTPFSAAALFSVFAAAQSAGVAKLVLFPSGGADPREYIVDHITVENGGQGVRVLKGRIAANVIGYVLLVLSQSGVCGLAQVDTRSFEIFPTPDGPTSIDEIDPIEPPFVCGVGLGDGAEVIAPPGTAPGETTSGAEIDPSLRILILVADQPSFWWRGNPLFRFLAAKFLTTFINWTWSLSGLVEKVEVVVEEVAYPPAGAGISTDLDMEVAWMRADLHVAARRDVTHSDVVVLLVSNDDPAGYGGRAAHNNVALYDHVAFSVVNWNKAISNFALPHEIGHAFGLMHDRVSCVEATPMDAGPGRSPYVGDCNYGWIKKVGPTHWGTIMRTDCSCTSLGGCVPAPLYSSWALSGSWPKKFGIACSGTDTSTLSGATLPAWNAQQLKWAFPRVAKFR